MDATLAARFYREEADRLRIAAAATPHADVRSDLLTLAARYDQLAGQSARWDASRDTEPPGHVDRDC